MIGTFSRYEKISVEYLNLVSEILSENLSMKIIIAGSNDRSTTENKLKKFIITKQAIVLGFSDVNILGNCCNVFLDTIPFPCGFSAIEIMAKGKPVLSLNSINLGNYKKSRISELIFDNARDLIQCLKEFQSEINFYKSMSEKSVEIAKGFDNETKLINLIDSL